MKRRGSAAQPTSTRSPSPRNENYLAIERQTQTARGAGRKNRAAKRGPLLLVSRTSPWTGRRTGRHQDWELARLRGPTQTKKGKSMITQEPACITEKQAAARRANGRLSRGPKTPEGKAVSSTNAFKHGFFTLDPLLPGESETEFAAFRDGLRESFRPANQAEDLLINRMADSAWRLRRFPAVEAALFSSELLAEQSSLIRRKAQGL